MPILCNPYQNSNDILHRNRKKILKFIQKQKQPKIAKAIMSKDTNAGGITIPNFTFYPRAIVTNTALYLHKNRHRPMEKNRVPRNEPT
jgi:hypothetical protein